MEKKHDNDDGYRNVIDIDQYIVEAAKSDREHNRACPGRVFEFAPLSSELHAQVTQISSSSANTSTASPLACPTDGAGAWNEIQLEPAVKKHSGCCCCCKCNSSSPTSMNEKKNGDNKSKVGTRRDRVHAALWLVALALVYIIMTSVFVTMMKNDKEESMSRHGDRINPDAVESGKTKSALVLNGNGTAAEPFVHQVEVGFYMDRISEFSIIESEWTADFYLWFRWMDEHDGEEDNSTVDSTTRRRNRKLVTIAKPTKPLGVSREQIPAAEEAAAGVLDPGATFHIIDGELIAKEELERHVNPVTTVPYDESLYLGGNTTQKYLHYTLYRVQAKLTKFFSIMRFPRDNHLMTLRIEDVERDHQQLMYVADSEGSRVSSRVQITGYALDEMYVISRLHAYKSARGNPWAEPDVQINFSQFTGAISIVRPNWGLYLMMFQGVFAAVGVALIGLCIKNDSRYDLGIGGFFAVVAATYISSTQLPMAGVFSLADYINFVSLLTVLLTLLHIFIERHIFKDSKERWFSAIGLAIFVMGYTGCICGMSSAASV